MAPPKKVGGAAAASKKPASPHGSYKDMIKESIIALKDRSGSSRQALKKYILVNFKPTLQGSSFDAAFNKALKTGVEKGDFTQPKGPSGPVKLAKKEAAEKKPAAAEKKAAPKPKSETNAKKAAGGKKGAAKAASSASAKAKMSAGGKKGGAKSSVKKTATTTAAKKANTGTKRKTPTAAPAVVDQPTVLNKTKSGRVSKGKAPTPGSTSAKRSAAGKKGAAKSSATKKKAEPAA